MGDGQVLTAREGVWAAGDTMVFVPGAGRHPLLCLYVAFPLAVE